MIISFVGAFFMVLFHIQAVLGLMQYTKTPYYRYKVSDKEYANHMTAIMSCAGIYLVIALYLKFKIARE